ncbi:MAG: hypothetical protein WCE79_14705 [Xanthobacteraceae bacterium]
MNFLGNLSVNLKAAGPAAVICVWLIALVLISLFVSAENAERAFGLLAISGGMILAGFALKA